MPYHRSEHTWSPTSALGSGSLHTASESKPRESGAGPQLLQKTFSQTPASITQWCCTDLPVRYCHGCEHMPGRYHMCWNTACLPLVHT